MSATLLSFDRRHAGWDNEERALLARVERLIREAGIVIDVEDGLTEDGDPWRVFCAPASGDVVIHVARIDGCYLLDSTVIPEPVTGRSLTDCAERFLAGARLVSPVATLGTRRGRGQRDGKGAQLYVHPSAMLAGVYIAILLYAQMFADKAAMAARLADALALGPDGAPDQDTEAAPAPKVAGLDDASVAALAEAAVASAAAARAAGIEGETEPAHDAPAAARAPAPWLADLAAHMADIRAETRLTEERLAEARAIEARAADRAADRLAADAGGAPSIAWAVLQSAAMMATLVLAQEREALAEFLGLDDEEKALAALGAATAAPEAGADEEHGRATAHDARAAAFEAGDIRPPDATLDEQAGLEAEEAARLAALLGQDAAALAAEMAAEMAAAGSDTLALDTASATGGALAAGPDTGADWNGQFGEGLGLDALAGHTGNDRLTTAAGPAATPGAPLSGDSASAWADAWTALGVGESGGTVSAALNMLELLFEGAVAPEATIEVAGMGSLVDALLSGESDRLDFSSDGDVGSASGFAGLDTADSALGGAQGTARGGAGAGFGADGSAAFAPDLAPDPTAQGPRLGADRTPGDKPVTGYVVRLGEGDSAVRSEERSLFYGLVETLAGNGQVIDRDGTVIHFHDNYNADTVTDDDVLVLSYTHADESQSFLVTYASHLLSHASELAEQAAALDGFDFALA